MSFKKLAAATVAAPVSIAATQAIAEDSNVPLIPRADIFWLDANAPISEVLKIVVEEGHARYPVCRGGLDDVIGVITAQALLRPLAAGQTPVITEELEPPVFVPETRAVMSRIGPPILIHPH